MYRGFNNFFNGLSMVSKATRRDVLLAASSIALSIPTFPDVALADSEKQFHQLFEIH